MSGWGQLPAELRLMLEEMDRAGPIYRPSAFWDQLNASHLAEISSERGYAHFKRTLNNSYFQFGFYAFPRALPALLAAWARRRDLRVLKASFERRTTVKFAPLLARATAIYAEAVASRSGGELLWKLEEPAVGDPLIVRYGSRRTTQDLCHSVEEYLSVQSATGLRGCRVAEVGAGYGRLAYVWLRADPSSRYHIVDIPPALYVSQRYLTDVLPELRVFRFRPFERYTDVASEIETAQLVFLEPHQLELIPDRYYDVMLTISTLQEMRRDQIRNYLHLVDRKCNQAFYLKQWRRWRNPVDEVDVSISDYRMPDGWEQVFQRSPLLPREFFEALYLRAGSFTR